MILNPIIISQIEEKCNTLSCCECGKKHHVSILWKCDVITPTYSDDKTCLGFKRQVSNLIKTEVKRYMNDPLPYLK